MSNKKYNKYNVYNNAVKNTKISVFQFNAYELKYLENCLKFNSHYSKMYRHIAQNLIYNFSNYTNSIVLNSYQVDGLKDCIENYLKKFKTNDNENKTLSNIKKNLIVNITED